ncbi:HigA family addiction module antitoxin [Qipengyuania sp.]|uniref:HigA family addiction module antitoxin n=1 Tax=Qipengyuania sp. TaxID=2004515 RepID=UPI003BAAFC36
MIEVPHPGEFLAEELECRGWSQRDLAYILGVSEQGITQIVNGRRGISPEMAKALGDAFDVNPEFFTNLQKAYDLSRAKEPDPGIARRAQFQSVYPIREMIRRGWLEDTDVPMLEGQLMRFFHTNDISSIPHLAHAAKKKSYDVDTPEQLAWLYRVRQISSEIVVPRYSKKALEEVIKDQLPALMTDPEEVRHVPRLLAECGIRFAIVEHLDKTHIDGVCFWDSGQPVVAMTTRFDRIDNFWFVLWHELTHVLNEDGKKKGTRERVDANLKYEISDDLPPEEKRANKAAADACVPIREMDSFYARKAPYISEKDVLGFARRIKRHPGIVVGQLQYRMDRYNWLPKYKVAVRKFIAQSAVMDGWGNPAPVSL